ncbi:MAG: DUF1653 domain-containing protein [bacterium]
MDYDLKAGVYQHYKGNYYLVLGIARHDVTEEKLVVYVALYTAKPGPRMSARPINVFFENIELDGKSVPRFRYIGQEIPQ